MKISASVTHAGGAQSVSVATNGVAQSLPVPAKANGEGSAVNGGEFLMLALATCYCNDLYREAKRMGIRLERVEVQASAEFAGVGMAASNIRYRASVASPEAPERIAQLIRETDAVAEVHNTIRAGVPVSLTTPNVDAVRAIYAALNRGDIEAVVQHFDEQIVWIEPWNLPDSVYRGLPAVHKLFSETRAKWAEGSCEPEGITIVGDKVVVDLYVHVRLAHESEWREGRHCAVYSFRNGKALEMRIIEDRQQALDYAADNKTD